MFFHFVTKHRCDGQTHGQTERITTPKTAIALLCRAAKTSVVNKTATLKTKTKTLASKPVR